ncbi:MAG: hypothetical protein ACKVP4_09875 [Hyphomicrobium sp.]
MRTQILVSIFVATSALSAATSAQSRERGESLGMIKACSTYGRGCVSAPVRMTSLGAQYRSPGGNWTWCEHDCRDTLRRDTIDFWDDQRERSK